MKTLKTIRSKNSKNLYTTIQLSEQKSGSLHLNRYEVILAESIYITTFIGIIILSVLIG